MVYRYGPYRSVVSRPCARPCLKRFRHVRTGARTAWHTHPLGQALIVTAGVGRVQVQGGPIQEVRPGDTVWFPPRVKHWHGAAPGVSMTHISVAEEEGGNNVEWLEKVTEDQYMGNEGRCAERR